MDKTFFIETWGCQMNDLDTQRLSGQLQLRGYRRVQAQSEASLILLNTCSIRETSEQKVLSHIGRLRDEKARGARIGICGCVAQQEGQALLDRSPIVDFVMGPGNVGRIDEILEGSVRLAVDFPELREYDHLSIDRPSAVRAQVTIIEGCNKNCTFCIVPVTRGREVSRPFDAILAEVRHAVGTGRVEIELLGQTVNAYRCPVTSRGFGDLLKAVASVEGVLRVRFVTSHPAEIDARVIEVIRENPNICRYLHLPVQSGSSSVLRRMKRLYTRERYLEVVDEIRCGVPDMRFSTDIIVGFPGETDEEFAETVSLLRKVRFGSIFAFKYSPRPGTAALKLGPAVEDEIASRRLAEVFGVQEEIERDTLFSYEGRSVRVLHEGPSRHDPGVYSGKTEDNWTVNFTARRSVEVASLVDVRISTAKHHSLFGELVE
jgi:tRNA-2-methylthio-N6-dimethylallyladenosine synthase